MSLAEVQERTAEIAARLRALQPAAAGQAALTPATSATAFSTALRQVTAAGSAAAVEATGPGSGDLGQRAVDAAKSAIGTPYKWGGSKPGGFDCSGLVQWAYAQQGIDLPRVSSDQAKAGHEVSVAEARPGDLVFFEHGAIDHIGIYAGNGQWVEAPHTGANVRLTSVDLAKATHIRRVTPDAGAAATGSSVGAGSVGAGSVGVGSVGVGSVGVGDWVKGLPASGQRYGAMIEQAAAKAGIDPRLLASVAWSESGFNPSARSGAGAQGLMQLMPGTARGLGVDPLDPQSALNGGAAYLATQLRSFGGRTDLALAAYNAGPSAVRRTGGVPPYTETQNYVRTVLAHLSALGGSP